MVDPGQPLAQTTEWMTLLVQSDPVDAKAVLDALAGDSAPYSHVEWETQLPSALQRLGRERFDVVLLDLALTDGGGMDALAQVLGLAPNSIVVVLCAESWRSSAPQAKRLGADDYFVMWRDDPDWLPRMLGCLIERKCLRKSALGGEARFQAISDASPLGVFVSDAGGGCTYTNAAYQKIAGLSLQESIGEGWCKAVHPEDRQRVLAEWLAALASEASYQTDYRFLRGDRSIVWTRVTSAAIVAGSVLEGRINTVEDISAHTQVELALRRSEAALFAEQEHAQVTLNSIGDAVISTDLLGNVNYLNHVAEAMTGWSSGEARGRPLPEVFRIIDGVTRENLANPAQRAMAANGTVGLAANSLLIRRDGFESAVEDSSSPIHNREGNIDGAVIVFHDVSESRFMALKMAHLAQHDALTGLPNRVLLTERLSQAVALALRHGKQGALLFLDLDGFKDVNDSLGHAVGDLLLQAVAERLCKCVRATDTVCRQGGDEFVILLPEIERPVDTTQVADKLLAAFAGPFMVGEHELHVTASIGISVYPDDGHSADSVMQNADAAMYHAKEGGHDCYRFFRPDMNVRAVHRHEIEIRLRRALANGEFLVHYQPQVDLATGRMIGVEALLRWKDPELGTVCPEQFVPVAEECGLIVAIGRWVLRESCRQVQAWIAAGLPAVPVGVNVSALEFRQPGFVENLVQVLADTGLPPAHLELEITESILMRDALASSLVLESLRNMGVRLAIDDFGTGYSSLSYLKRFPVQTLKVDQSLVRDVAIDADNATIVSAVIGIGSNLRQRVVAEGIETKEQLQFLRDHKCDVGQGFLFSHALAAEDFARLLAAGPDTFFPA
jgi:diguanylate cyclase (GGDEF)-like protein/PAS domain S-box-containing protein